MVLLFALIIGDLWGIAIAKRPAPDPAAVAAAKKMDFNTFYDRWLNQIRGKFAGALHKKIKPKAVSPLKAPASLSPADIKRLAKEHPLVRPMPYPFTAAVALSGVNPKLTFDQAYRLHMSASRAYGVDIPSTFALYNPEFFSSRLALFGGGLQAPLLLPIKLGTETIDALGLFLTYASRGWVSGLGAARAAISRKFLVDPAKATVGPKGHGSVQLKINAAPDLHWIGLRVGLKFSAGVKGFEIEIIDSNGLAHTVVYKRKLAGRPGWDLSRLSVKALLKAAVRLDQESNAKHLRVMGLTGDADCIKSARMVVYGKPGATLSLVHLRPMIADQAFLQDKAASMAKLSVLPALHPAPGNDIGSTGNPIFRIKPFRATGRITGLKGTKKKGRAVVQMSVAKAKNWRQAISSLGLGQSALINVGAFAAPADIAKPGPELGALLAALTSNKYGAGAKGKRLWVAPGVVNFRFQLAMSILSKRATRKGNQIHVKPLKGDSVYGQFPNPRHLTQDLHGMTFYVPDASKAQVFCGKREITSLKRNPPDQSGRPSVTIVDTSYAKVVFDEVDFSENNGRVWAKDATRNFLRKDAYTGTYAMQLKAEGGAGRITWKPFLLNAHGVDFLRFAYRKSNPAMRVAVGWITTDGRSFTAYEGAPEKDANWSFPMQTDRKYHEVVLGFSDAAFPGNKITSPRGAIKSFWLGFIDAKPGDTVLFDTVEFLAQRENRVAGSKGVLVGGRIFPPEDSRTISIRINGQAPRTTTTTRGGWYFFENVPLRATVEITFSKDGNIFYPAKGRVLQVGSSLLGADIYATDPRMAALPRPEWKFTYTMEMHKETRLLIRKAMNRKAHAQYRKRYISRYGPHERRLLGGPFKVPIEHFIDGQANNYGYIDRDRSITNQDGALRIVLLGACWQLGFRIALFQQIATILESMLRRELGINVEVIPIADGLTGIGHMAAMYNKYGYQFKPDVIIIFASQHNIYLTDPLFAKYRVGWPVGHAAKNTYDFNKNGDAFLIPSDPRSGAHLVKREEHSIIKEVPMGKSGYVMSKWNRRFYRAVQLIPAIFEQIRGTKNPLPMAVVTGVYASEGMPYNSGSGQIGLAVERWNDHMRQMCKHLGIRYINLLVSLRRYSKKSVHRWINNGHPTPQGHYATALAVLAKLKKWPKFNEAVRRAKKRQHVK